MTPYREKVNEAARAMWFGGVRQWPTADYPQELTRWKPVLAATQRVLECVDKALRLREGWN